MTGLKKEKEDPYLKATIQNEKVDKSESDFLRIEKLEQIEILNWEKQNREQKIDEFNVVDDDDKKKSTNLDKNTEILSSYRTDPNLDNQGTILRRCEAEGTGEEEEKDDEDHTVVAIPVNEKEKVKAIEYDPDIKNNNLQIKKRRLYLLFFLICMTTMIGIIGVVVGITLSSNNNEDSVIIPYRETLGIRENIEQLLGTKYSNHLQDHSSPYYKAMEWITHTDPIQPTPNHPQFSQRFFLAYFYFATSKKQPWVGGCNPPQENETDNCILLYDGNHFFQDKGPQKITSQRWLSAAHTCLWAGIKCDELQQIVKIDLAGMNQTGTFPEGILIGFPFLQQLKLILGQLSGTIPDSIWTSKHLLEVSFRSQNFFGTISDHVFLSRSLKNLDLADNQLEGTISTFIGELRDVKNLVLSRNFLTGPIPIEIGKLSNTVDVQLDHNSLKGFIPSTVGGLYSLKRFYGHQNAIRGRLPSDLGLVPNLLHLTFQFNELTGPIPEEIYNCTELSYLILNNNELTGTLSTKIGQIGQLCDFSIVDLRNNKMSGTLPTELGLITSYASFAVSGNDFSGSMPAEFCTLKMNGSKFEFDDVRADCKIPVSGDPEIICPKHCCTLCCDSDGKNCVDT